MSSTARLPLVPPDVPPGFLPWRGAFIEVAEDGRWSFWACVRCGQPLEATASRLDGFGYDCVRRVDADHRTRLLRSALGSERRQYRDDQAVARWHAEHPEMPWRSAGAERRPASGGAAPSPTVV